jgi:hypothetical protein
MASWKSKSEVSARHQRWTQGQSPKCHTASWRHQDTSTSRKGRVRRMLPGVSKAPVAPQRHRHLAEWRSQVPVLSEMQSMAGARRLALAVWWPWRRKGSRQGPFLSRWKSNPVRELSSQDGHRDCIFSPKVTLLPSCRPDSIRPLLPGKHWQVGGSSKSAGHCLSSRQLTSCLLPPFVGPLSVHPRLSPLFDPFPEFDLSLGCHCLVSGV